MTAATCAVEGCTNPVRHRSLCGSHYKRVLRYGDPLAGGTAYGEPDRWINDIAAPYLGKDCLEWPFAKAAGYGSVRINGRAVGAHRLVCELVHGPSPSDGLEAAHSCGNSGCVNPNHLRWATPSENCADKKSHGTQPVGERVGGSKFKDADVLEMRRLRKAGLTYQAIADRYHHDIGATRRIIVGETWRHLPL